MTTDNPTVHERVQQALAHDLELQTRLQALQNAVMAAKQAEDAVRKDMTRKNNLEALKGSHERIMAKAKALYDEALDKAEAPFVVAGTKYRAELASAEATLAKVTDESTAAYNAKVEVETKAAELEAATARATVYRAEQEVAAHRATIDQHRRQVQEKLGISLKP